MKTYYQPTYRANIILVEYRTREDVKEELNKGLRKLNFLIVKDDKVIDDLYREDLSAYSITLEMWKLRVHIIGINKNCCNTIKKKNSSLVHEVEHTLFKIYNGVGIKSVKCSPEENGNEPEAYLVGELYDAFQF